MIQKIKGKCTIIGRFSVEENIEYRKKSGNVNNLTIGTVFAINIKYTRGICYTLLNKVFSYEK